MAQFLATLQSQIDERGGLAIIDSNLGLIYLQSDESLCNSSFDVRGVTQEKDNIYVATPASILVYSVDNQSHKPLLHLEKEFSLPEWQLGTKLRADILDILVSSDRGELFVANNNFNSVDRLTLEGDFISRHFLHDIAPALFVAPSACKKIFRYGQIRNFCEAPDGSILLSIHDINSSGEGCVLNFDTGEIVINGLQAPHGLIFNNDVIVVQEAEKSRISAFKYSSSANNKMEKIWSTCINELNEDSKNINSSSTGLAYFNGFIYCGVYHSISSANESLASSLIWLDAETGDKSSTELSLPDVKGFKQPQVLFLLLMHAKFDTENNKRAGLYVKGEQFMNMPSLPAKKVFSVNSKPNCVRQIHKKHTVILKDVSLSFRRSTQSLFSFNKRHNKKKEFCALNNISFTIYEGETVGIIGRNGSGKSTVSRLISGALPVDSGKLITQGHVQLLSIGLGFQPNLTGRDNVFINGALLGLNRKEIIEKMSDIVSFAEIDDFIDEPVQTYSAGMRSRLGFGIATAVRPDILILDEVMSTGDASFRAKADQRMELMREQTKTIILVSHNPKTIRKMCTRVIWLNNGEVMMDDTPKNVLPRYNEFCTVAVN